MIWCKIFICLFGQLRQSFFSWNYHAVKCERDKRAVFGAPNFGKLWGDKDRDRDRETLRINNTYNSNTCSPPFKSNTSSSDNATATALLNISAEWIFRRNQTKKTNCDLYQWLIMLNLTEIPSADWQCVWTQFRQRKKNK